MRPSSRFRIPEQNSSLLGLERVDRQELLPRLSAKTGRRDVVEAVGPYSFPHGHGVEPRLDVGIAEKEAVLRSAVDGGTHDGPTFRGAGGMDRDDPGETRPDFEVCATAVGD